MTDLCPMTEPIHRRSRIGRRGRVALGLAAGAALLAPRLGPWLGASLGPAPPLVPDPALPGVRRLEGLAATALPPAFAGLDPGPDHGAGTVPAGALCAWLFPGGLPAGRVPVAVFTDINCPHCRVMEPWLAELSADRVALSWHDMPLLGPASAAGARAIVAARRQGADGRMRDRLHRSRFLPDPAYLAALAGSIGIDPDRLQADMAAPATGDRLARSVALARALGLPGTPALVIGDIIAPGVMTRPDLDALIAVAGPPPCA